jgi:hypothetical protein
MPEDVGDVSFDAPERSWGAQLSRITVNLFLFEVAQSDQPARPVHERLRSDGRTERRPSLPMVRLSYLVTAWAGSTADEHALLSDVLRIFATHQHVPPEHLDADVPGAVQLALGSREGRRSADLWSSLEGRLRPSLLVDVTLPLSAEFALAPPSVSRVAGLVAPQPAAPPAPTQRGTATMRTRRQPDGSLVSIPVADAEAPD